MENSLTASGVKNGGHRMNKKMVFLIVINWVLILTVFSYYNSTVIRKFDEVKLLTVRYMQQRSGSVGNSRKVVTANVNPGTDDTNGNPGNLDVATNVNPLAKTVIRESVTGFQRTPIEKLKAMDLKQLYDYYLQLVTVPTIQCQHIVRYGNVKDGGWEVCQDDHYAVKKPCLVYSMGINWDFSFDDAISKAQGCVVHSFDPSMKTNSFNRSNLVQFHNYGLKGATVNTAKKQFIDQTNFELKNFDEVLTSLGHKEKSIDFYKMDIDGPEWRSMDLILKNNLLKHVRQFAWEFHVFQWEFNKQKFLYAVTILERLREAGFEMYLVHVNPSGHFANPVLGKKTPCCYECYYLNTKYVIGKDD